MEPNTNIEAIFGALRVLLGLKPGIASTAPKEFLE